MSPNGVTLAADELVEIIAELETARQVMEIPSDGSGWPMVAQREMLAQLLLNLSAGVAGPPEARLVAGVVLQEVAGLMRMQVRSESR